MISIDMDARRGNVENGSFSAILRSRFLEETLFLNWQPRDHRQWFHAAETGRGSGPDRRVFLAYSFIRKAHGIFHIGTGFVQDVCGTYEAGILTETSAEGEATARSVPKVSLRTGSAWLPWTCPSDGLPVDPWKFTITPPSGFRFRTPMDHMILSESPKGLNSNYWMVYGQRTAEKAEIPLACHRLVGAFHTGTFWTKTIERRLMAGQVPTDKRLFCHTSEEARGIQGPDTAGRRASATAYADPAGLGLFCGIVSKIPSCRACR